MALKHKILFSLTCTAEASRISIGQCHLCDGKRSVFPQRRASLLQPSCLSLRIPLPWIGKGGLWISYVFLVPLSYSQELPRSCSELTQLLLLGCTWIGGGWDDEIHDEMSLHQRSALPHGFSHNEYRLFRLESSLSAFLWSAEWGVYCQVGHRGCGRQIPHLWNPLFHADRLWSTVIFLGTILCAWP